MRSPVFFRGRKLLYYRDHYYPEDETTAYEKIHTAFRSDERTQNDKTRIIIVPNGSYRYCSGIMAAAYARLCPESITRIFIFARCKTFLPYYGALTSMDNLETPLGRLPVDTEVNAALMKTGDFKYFDVPTDQSEQFVEMQLPFIAKLMENRKGYFKVIPIYIGTLAHDQQVVLARRFLNYVNDPQNVFIFSVSLCHWGEIYGYNITKTNADDIQQSIDALDNKAINAIKQLRFKPFDQFLLDSKAKIFDNQIISLCLLIVQQLLDSELYEIVKMSEDKAAEAMRTKATFRLLGKGWSFACTTPKDSCITYISAGISLSKTKYVQEAPEEVNPLEKCC